MLEVLKIVRHALCPILWIRWGPVIYLARRIFNARCFYAFDSVDDERCSRSFMSFGTAPSLVAALSLWRFSGLAIAASFYLPSKCVRYFWLRLWHSTSSMKLHFVHFLPMLTLPWRNSRALIVTDANTRSFLLKGSCEHAHRLHSFIKNKSLSTNLNRKLPRLLDLCFYKLHYTDSKFYQDELRSRCFIVVIDMTPVLASRVSVATCATRILLLTC